MGAPENPYDDPIPGSDTWTIEQLETAIRDFEGLKNKVDNLNQVYSTKMEVCVIVFVNIGFITTRKNGSNFYKFSKINCFFYMPYLAFGRM